MGESILVLGGTRSGKSRLAESLAAAQGGPVAYLATALTDPSDPEMTARIARHRERRPSHWTTHEIPRELEQVLPELASSNGSVLVDCVTLWITNLILGLGGGPALDDAAVLEAVDRVSRMSSSDCRIIWVSNEVGSGIIPENPLARRFADLQGLVNQRLATVCDAVYFCVAGLSVQLK